MTKLLECMDHTFGDVREYDTMICSLYEIQHKDGESVEEYMLRIHEAVVMIWRLISLATHIGIDTGGSPLLQRR